MIIKYAKDLIVKFVNWLADMADKFGLKRNQFLTIFLAVIIALSIVAYIIVALIAKMVVLNLRESLTIFLIAIIALATVAYVIVALFLFKFAKQTAEDNYKLLLLNILLFYERSMQEKTASISDAAIKLLESERISKELREKLKQIFPEEARQIFDTAEGEQRKR